MRWEEERYVRVYTRETPEDVALGWEGCAVWWALLRRFDRAGILEMGKTGTRGLAGLIRFPVEVVERALPLLLEDGRVQMVGSRLIAPNYIAANETPQSDRARQREKRERDRARAMCDTESQNVTEQSQNVTPESRAVTPSHALSLRAVPCRAEEQTPATAGPGPSGSGDCSAQANPAPEPAPVSVRPLTAGPAPLLDVGKGAVDRIFAAHVDAWRQSPKGRGGRPPALTDKRRKLIRAALKNYPEADLIAAASGIFRSKFHVDEGHTSIDLALRDAEHIERFRDTMNDPAGTVSPATPGHVYTPPPAIDAATAERNRLAALEARKGFAAIGLGGAS